MKRLLLKALTVSWGLSLGCQSTWGQAEFSRTRVQYGKIGTLQHYYFVGEDQLAPLALAPLALAECATHAFLANDKAEAVLRLNAAVAVMHLEMYQGAPASQELTLAASDLDQLTQDVDTGSNASAAAVRASLTGSALAFAQHYRNLAAKAWFAEDPGRTATALAAAADAMRVAIRWSGRQVAGRVQAAVSAAADLAESLRLDSGWTKPEADRTLATFNWALQQTDELGARAAH